jgi:hypothetical protein
MVAGAGYDRNRGDAIVAKPDACGKALLPVGAGLAREGIRGS